MDYLSHGEIHVQAEVFNKTLSHVLKHKDVIKRFFEQGRDIVLIGCGSSYWLSLSAHKTMHLLTGRHCYAVKAGDVYMCPEEFDGLYDSPLFLVPSRSGRTKEVLEALRVLKAKYPGSKVLSVIEYTENDLAGLSDVSLNIEWATEKSVCQTRSFNNLYLSMVLIAAIISDCDAMIESFKTYFAALPNLVIEYEPVVKDLARADAVTGVVALGSGRQYGVTIEGAYIVIEMAEYPANFYQLLEYRHGPIVTGGKGTCVFICCGSEQNAEAEAKMAAEIKETGAKVYAVADKAKPWADCTFETGAGYVKEVTALHFVQVMQSFAFHLSVSRGKNPDSPGNLVPFITF